IREREKDCEIVYPRVEGYRVELPEERIAAHFTNDHRLRLTPELVGPCKVRMEPLVGGGIDLSLEEVSEAIPPSPISFNLAKHLLYMRFRDPGEEPPLYLFGQIQRV